METVTRPPGKGASTENPGNGVRIGTLSNRKSCLSRAEAPSMERRAYPARGADNSPTRACGECRDIRRKPRTAMLRIRSNPNGREGEAARGRGRSPPSWRSAPSSGILFATGVFGKKGDEANEPTAESSTSVTSPKRETPTEPTSRPSTPSTTGSTPSPDRPSLPTEPTTVTAGQPVQVGDFQMTFLEFNPNATSALAARGLTPQSGSKFVGVKLKATNTSAKEERPGKVGLMIEGVYMETLGYHESDGMRSVSSLQPGQSVEAWQYIQIPESMQPTSYTYNYYSTDYNIYKSAKNITVRIS